MTRVSTILLFFLLPLLGACGGVSDPVSDLTPEVPVVAPEPTPVEPFGNYIPSRPKNTNAAAAEKLYALFESLNEVDPFSGAPSQPVLFGVPSGTVPNSEWAVLGGGIHAGVPVGAVAFEDSENAERVVYFLESASDYFGIGTFTDRVTVRAPRGAHQNLRDNVRAVVDMLNRLLPDDRRLVIGPDANPLPDPLFPYESAVGCSPRCPLLVPDNQIVLATVDDLVSQGYVGQMYPDNRSDGSRRAAYLALDTDAASTHRFTNLIAHEMLHALGLGHVSPSIFPDALLSTGGFDEDTRGKSDRLLSAPHYPFGVVCLEQVCSYSMPTLRAVEGEAIYALYNRFARDGFVDYDQISVHSLGEWDDRAVRLFGVVETPGGDVGFGVDFRHPSGWARPWFTGLQTFDNIHGHGTAVWNGAILGVTPRLDPVIGQAKISVDLDTSQGGIDFDDLVTDDGSGAAVWGDGRLAYTIEVNYNGLYRTGGAQGELFGAFFGDGHEGVGGTLERDDLVAAFGAKRATN